MLEVDLLEKKDLRDGLIDRIEVLEKVKQLLLINGTDYATTELVANFYEVGNEAIKSIIFKNKDELISDGMKVISGSETRDILVSCKKQLTNCKGYFECDGQRFANRSNTLFTRRSILRVGMLLRDSAIAKEVRTQLLNIEEKVLNEIKIADITEEQTLALEMGMAFMNGSLEDFAMASKKLVDFKNRHIKQLEDMHKVDQKQLLEQKPKVEFHDKINNSVDCVDLGQFSKMLKSSNNIDIGRNKLFNLLRNEKVLMSNNVPYQTYLDRGYFVVKEVPRKTNSEKIDLKPLITGKGQTWIIKTFF